MMAGWNDPPKFAYSAKEGCNKLLFTKRVPHSINNEAQTTSVNSRWELPPTKEQLAFNVPSNPLKTSEDKSKVCNLELCSEEKLPERLLSCTESLVINKSLVDKSAAEIKKKLALFSADIEAKKLSSIIMQQMAKLVNHLENGDYDAANSIHLALMVDHTQEVLSWMIGVKKLIFAAKDAAWKLTT